MNPPGQAGPGQWVLLSYRLPREPSTPRIGVWRKLERLGVARLGDGLVALPADARTREQVDWLAEEVVEAGGVATTWLAVSGSAAQERAVAGQMRAARAAEYRTVTEQARVAARGAATERARTFRRLRRELRRIARRDFFPPAERDTARSAVDALADVPAGSTPTPRPPAPSVSGEPP
ncbi:MAG TPA: Chromate resistance protein ChrB [Actinomycetes bacterium]